MKLLKFSQGNAKIKFIPSLNFPSGHACPFADKCLSKVGKINNSIIDGKTEFRCFSASAEVRLPNVKSQRWYNFDLIKKLNKEQMIELINNSLPQNVRFIRLHVSGDFFSKEYMKAWIEVAKLNPEVVFYTYTKSIPYWIDLLNEIPNNLRLTASLGGKHDALIFKHNLKYAEVVYSLEEAIEKGLEIDHDDSSAYSLNTKSFALLIHGTQPIGSEAGRANYILQQAGLNGYRKENYLIAV